MLALMQIRVEVGLTGAGDVDNAGFGVQGMLMMLAPVQVILAEVGFRGTGDVDDACPCASDTGRRGGFDGCRGC